MCFVGGVLACHRTGRDLGVVDHGSIVWDEIVPFWLVLFFCPVGQFWWQTALWQTTAFLLFRIYDIFKPYPANREGHFHTQRPAGSTFCFALQGDSHPERAQMHDPALYARTLLQAAGDRPDFYLCMGDDFSVDTLHTVTAETVAERYALQHPFLGLVGQSAAVFLVNGNHEQTSRFNFNQTDLRHSVAVWGQQARSRYYPLPIPDGFLAETRNGWTSSVPWATTMPGTWGDALFVVLDLYWHSPELVDNGFEGDRVSKDASGKKAQEGRRQRDGWDVTLGDAQYRWFQRTLAESRAKFKFVFAHHVLGTSRGGIEECDLFEWGGHKQAGRVAIPAKAPRLGIADPPTDGPARRDDLLPRARPPLRAAGTGRDRLSGGTQSGRSRLCCL